MTTDELKSALHQLHTMLGKGQFLEAMEQFLHDDVVLLEAEAPAKTGKKHVMEIEAKVLEDVAEFGGYEVSSVGFGDDRTFYQAVMEYTQKDGTKVRVDQCVVDEWKDGKIVRERFYHA